MQTRREIDELYAALPTLRSERLRLVPLELGHADALFEIFSDPAVTRYTNDTPHSDVEVTRERVRGILERQTLRSGIAWALFLHDEAQPIGHSGLHSISWTNRRADLGFELASRYWRRGYMTEALRAVIAFSFAELRFVKLAAQATLENEPCHALLAKLRFVEEGLLRQHGFWKGRAHDLKAYGLVAADFEATP